MARKVTIDNTSRQIKIRRSIRTGGVKMVGRKDRQGQVGLLVDGLLGWEDSCPEGHQKPGLKVLMSGTCYSST